MNIKGILTNCYTNKESTVNLEYEINENDRHELIFKLLNGVTGYESFYIDDYAEENMPMFGWLACAGTQQKWDKLFIPAEEMKKAFDELKNNRRLNMKIEGYENVTNTENIMKKIKNGISPEEFESICKDSPLMSEIFRCDLCNEEFINIKEHSTNKHPGQKLPFHFSSFGVFVRKDLIN